MGSSSSQVKADEAAFGQRTTTNRGRREQQRQEEANEALQTAGGGEGHKKHCEGIDPFKMFYRKFMK